MYYFGLILLLPLFPARGMNNTPNPNTPPNQNHLLPLPINLACYPPITQLLNVQFLDELSPDFLFSLLCIKLYSLLQRSQQEIQPDSNPLIENFPRYPNPISQSPLPPPTFMQNSTLHTTPLLFSSSIPQQVPTSPKKLSLKLNYDTLFDSEVINPQTQPATLPPKQNLTQSTQPMENVQPVIQPEEDDTQKMLGKRKRKKSPNPTQHGIMSQLKTKKFTRPKPNSDYKTPSLIQNNLTELKTNHDNQKFSMFTSKSNSSSSQSTPHDTRKEILALVMQTPSNSEVLPRITQILENYKTLSPLLKLLCQPSFKKNNLNHPVILYFAAENRPLSYTKILLKRAFHLVKESTTNKLKDHALQIIPSLETAVYYAQKKQNKDVSDFLLKKISKLKEC